MQNNEQIQQHPAFLFLKKHVLHNWRWKVTSLILAICLWGGLITQDDTLTREKTFNDVKISVRNSDTLRRNGYIIVDGLDDLPELKLRVEVPQRTYNTVTASNYDPRIDLSKITSAGEQTLNILTTNTTTYGSVSSISESTVTLQVEEYITRSRIPARISYVGTLRDDLYGETPNADPAYVTVSGPKSLVNGIVRCIVQYDLSSLTETGVERTAAPFQLVNAAGEVIDSSLIDVTSESVLLDSILVQQELFASKEMPVNTTGMTVGEPANGYVIKSVTVEPAAIRAAGTDEWVAGTNALQLSEYVNEKIDVSGAASTIHRSVRIVKRAGLEYLSNETVLITVEIAPQ